MVAPLVAAGVSLGAQAVGAGKKVKGQKAQARAEATARREEARQIREDAIRTSNETEAVGQYNAGIVRRATRKMIGTQRAQMAGSGFAGAGQGDAGADYILEKTVQEMSVEELLVRHEADMAADTMRKQAERQATALETDANNIQASARRANTATVVGVGLDWASQYASFGKAKGPIGTGMGDNGVGNKTAKKLKGLGY